MIVYTVEKKNNLRRIFGNSKLFSFIISILSTLDIFLTNCFYECYHPCYRIIIE